MSDATRHWGVVGGGILGMTLALRLRQSGHRVTLLEAGERLGGLATPWRIGDITWDRHYHVILLSDSHLRALLAELGIDGELVWSPTKTGFYTGGRFHSMSTTLEFLSFPPLNLVEKFRLGLTILYASRLRDWKSLERVRVADWLRRWSGRGTTEKIWLPLLRAKLGDAYERTSAAFIWATINRMYAARRSGLKQEMFGYVKGGYARILDRFTDVLRERGVEIVLEAPTRRVAAAVEGGVEVAGVADDRRRFDRVVITAPAPVAARLCPGLTAAESERLRSIEYLGIVCASVLLRRRLSPYYVTNITESWVPFTAVIEMSALVDPEQLGGHALVYLPKYASAGDPVFAKSDAEIEAEFLAALRRMHPQLAADDVLAFQVSRVPHVFALPTLGYSDALPPTSTSIPGVHIVNSAHIVNGTLNVNETIQLADRMLPGLGMTGRPIASVSLDLDNQWSYMKTHGDPGWESFPSYLDVFVPHVLEALDALGLRITVFVVGQDAALDRNRDALALLAKHGHEIGNHSFRHEQWMLDQPREELRREIHEAAAAIVAATGQQPVGYRGPGFCWSADLLEVLAEAGYVYDASTLPTYVGPLARWYYFRQSRLTEEQRRERKDLFGGFGEGRRPLKPYRWRLDSGRTLIEMPVTTAPLFRTPFHLSYLLHLSRYSTGSMMTYLRAALALCRATRTEPSFLLHPLDLLGPDQAPGLAFFPGMDLSAARKREVFDLVLGEFKARYTVVPLGEHARHCAQRPLKERPARDGSWSRRASA